MENQNQLFRKNLIPIPKLYYYGMKGKMSDKFPNYENSPKVQFLSHIEKLVLKGKINRVDLSRILTSSLANSLSKIHSAFRELNTDRLSPVFNKFNGKYLYDELRIARLLLNKN